METIRVSNHAKQRLKERCGTKKSSAKRMASLAASRGVERSNTKGPLRRWLDAKYTSENGQVIAYGDKAYIFSDQMVLITVMQIPAPITKKMKNMIVSPA